LVTTGRVAPGRLGTSRRSPPGGARAYEEAPLTALRILLLAALVVALGPAGHTQSPSPTGALLDDLLPYKPREVQILALKALETRGDRGAIPALIELLRFQLDIPVELHLGVLEMLSGQSFGPAWPRWVEWLQQATDVVPSPGFVAWKGRLMSLIDPEFLEWFRPGIPHRIRMEEIVWGGVAKDGIPALTNPTHVPANRATYLTDDELVFGVTLNGDSRAYPHRIMDWHEMANDVVGGIPVALAY
jgi:hypothetical protein